MGLMFQMPLEENDLDDRIEVRNGHIRLRSYGLPMIFWGYLGAAFTVIIFMILAIYGPIQSILAGDDAINKIIAYAVLGIFIFGPIIALAFYFYEKELIKYEDQLTIKHKVFFIPVKSTTVTINEKNPLRLEHLLDSPNVAKMRQEKSMSGFENRGYYQVFAKLNNGREVLVDRNSQKREMRKLIDLLS